MSATIRFDDFERLFGPPMIRVLLNWDALRELEAPIRLLEAGSWSDVSAWFSPWYEDEQGTALDYSDSVKPPLRFSEMSARAQGTAARWERVRRIAADMSGMAPSVLFVATYDLGSGVQLVLDGNHRLAALTVGRLSGWRVAALSVRGPVSASMLPDLRHFA